MFMKLTSGAAKYTLPCYPRPSGSPRVLSILYPAKGSVEDPFLLALGFLYYQNIWARVQSHWDTLT